MRGQGLGAGTIQGSIKDPTGGVMQAVEVRISNLVTGFMRTTTTDAMGRMRASPSGPFRIHLECIYSYFMVLLWSF